MRASAPRVLTAAALAAALWSSCAPASEGRLVVVVVFDALHAGHVHHLGYARETTPHLDALAAEGVSFRNAHAPAPYTVASTASIMTGLLPQRHGLLRPFGRHARPGGVTLAEHLRGAGWQTLGASANANASTATSTDLGFDQWVDLFEGPGPEGVQRVQRGDGSFIHLVGADEWPQQLERFLDARDAGRDAFVYLHALQPHSPYAPPAEHRTPFVDPSYASSWADEEFPGGYAEGQDRPLAMANRGEIPMGEADRQHTLDLYDASLHWMDAALGEMVAGLRERGLWERTWLVVTSDHGEAFWQHGRFGHNDHLYEEMLRVPLVVRAPGGALPQGVVADALVSPMDLLPSLVEWLRLPEVPGLDGQSLGRALREQPQRRLLLQTNGNFPFVGMTDGRGKVIVSADGQGVRTSERYDLGADAAESTNLIAGGPAPPGPLAGGLGASALTPPSAGDPWLGWPEPLRAGALDALWDLRAGLHGWIAQAFAAAPPAGTVQGLTEALSPREGARGTRDVDALLSALGYGGGDDARDGAQNTPPDGPNDGR